MATASATPDDVRDEIDTALTDPELNSYLDKAAFELDLENDLSSMDVDVRERLEVLGAAIRILDRRERATSKEHREAVTLTFETGIVEELRDERDRIANSAGVSLPDDPDRQASYETF